MSKRRLSEAAQALCRLRGEDPDALDEIIDTTAGVTLGLKIVKRPKWTEALEEIEAELNRRRDAIYLDHVISAFRLED